MLSKNDIDQLETKGISIDLLNQQVKSFKTGFPWLNVIAPATPGDGINVYSPSEIESLAAAFDPSKKQCKIVKFVPASGAATRMFKSLFEQLLKPSGTELQKDVQQVIESLESFAFYNDLVAVLKKNGLSLAKLLEEGNYDKILTFILDEKGLNYGNQPKGLLKFHSYTDSRRTPVEEHLVEGAVYARNADGSVNIHFTVSPEHLEAFKQLITEVKEVYEARFKVRYNISFSVQKSSTDTLAVDADNQPFRDSDGSLLFRPGGHGALIDNLNDLDGGIIFIKNIDNVVPDRLKDETIKYKKGLAGLLMKTQTQVFEYLNYLDNTISPDDATLTEMVAFTESQLGYKFSPSFGQLSEVKRKEALIEVLNRPIRICGMVKNTGEPGGGPFWVENVDGSKSLQILESSQFNHSDDGQKKVFKSATHFNPVDLVISTYNYKGEKFDLTQYRDPQTGFISEKTKDGRKLKALELPGLWNGAMAFWNTAFVEVPGITFNPVKSVNDLLRPEHRNSNVKLTLC